MKIYTLHKAILNNKNYQWATFLVFILLFVFLGFGVLRLNVNQDITKSLPKGKEFKGLNNFLKKSNLNNELFFSVETNALATPDLEEVLEKITQKINADISFYTEPFQYYSAVDEMAFYDYFYQNIALYLDSNQLYLLKKQNTRQSIEQNIKANYKKIISPEGNFIHSFLLKDPLHYMPLVLQNFQSINNTDYAMEDGITFSKNRKYVLLSTSLKDTLQNNLPLQTQFSEVLLQLKEEWNEQNPNHQLNYFNPFLISVANAQQVKKDTILTLSIFIAIALLLLLIYYRKWLIVLYFMLPAVFGLLFSLGIIGWFKNEVSGISIAAGAIVLGIVLDYAFHFFTHYKATNSLEETINDISMPLLTGSLTTILAFGALWFTNSVILQDFGLFAALSLLGAAFFTLVIFPLILAKTNFTFSNKKTFNFSFKLPFSLQNRWGFYAIVALTIFFYFQAQNIQFDSDVQNLGYHPQALKNAEKSIVAINPDIDKQLYLIVKDKNWEMALQKNYTVYRQLQAIDSLNKIISVAPFLVPENIQQKRIIRWNNYWQKNKTQVLTAIEKNANETGFSSTAFDAFAEWINTNYKSKNLSQEFLIANNGLNRLYAKSDTESYFITTVVVPKKGSENTINQIKKIKNVELLDISTSISSMLDLVKQDFNFILLVSSLLVFFTLLLIYGRIELATIVFIPMLVSWIWIVGISALLGIKFNFVNIIITTFIFGLGDDFSIFISDGILNKFKYGKDILKTYKTGIVLSAITTIVGTGVLVFAQHPAIHSIGLISILGMLCIVFISFTLQPILYDWLIFNRRKKDRDPWTLSSLLLSIFANAYFLFGCLVASILGFGVVLLPIGKKNKQKAMGYIIHKFGSSLLYIMFNVRKTFYDTENLDLSKPSILIANHSSVLDIIITLSISPKVLLVTNKWVYYSPFFGYLVRTAGFVLNTDIESNLDIIKQKIDDGYSIMIFPEGTRSSSQKINRFKKGAFYLAEKLALDITPVLIHGAYFTMAKSDLQLKNSFLNIKYLPRIKFDDQNFGTSYRERAKNISKHFKTAHHLFRKEMETTTFLGEKIMYNYILKGPILEWYFRIKWKLESKNYSFYDQSIAERFLDEEKINILDLGCGYGFLDYYLSLRNSNRTITAIDYDQEKIDIAQNSRIKPSNMQFQQADLRTFALNETYDVVFLMDVLHYFGASAQEKLLQNVLENISANGIVFIRDGIKDLAQKHEKTKLTEFFSSHLGFNKVEEDFHFFERKFIEKWAKKYNLNIIYIEQSKNTSNVLFVLTKNKKQ